MPKKPGTSAEVTIDPAVLSQKADRTQKVSNPINSVTQDPFYGLEVGRDGTPPTTFGGLGEDVL
jgi:hypothetical protein